jgi:hypothetical protein
MATFFDALSGREVQYNDKTLPKRVREAQMPKANPVPAVSYAFKRATSKILDYKSNWRKD